MSQLRVWHGDFTVASRGVLRTDHRQAYDEYYHPTAWVGRRAVAFLERYAARARNSQQAAEGGNALTTAADPFFLKVSFHRPVVGSRSIERQ